MYMYFYYAYIWNIVKKKCPHNNTSLSINSDASKHIFVLENKKFYETSQNFRSTSAKISSLNVLPQMVRDGLVA